MADNSALKRVDPLRLAVLQRVCPPYRKGLFERIAADPRIDLRLFIGEDLPGTNVKSSPNLDNIQVHRLPTRFIRIAGHILFDHRGLIHALDAFQPDVILCEGESNILSYLKAIIYHQFHRMIGLVHWSLGGLPGRDAASGRPKDFAKFLLLKFFDTYITYSSYGEGVLRKLGCRPERIFVAINVSDTDYHLKQADSVLERRGEARERLGLPDRFTILYVGAIDENKKLDALIDAARDLDAELVNVVIVGDGVSLPALKAQAESLRLRHVFLPGHVDVGLPIYFRASDVFVLPGRGGMVISEAMAYGLPVVVYQADGTEFDLVIHGETGLRLLNGDSKTLLNAIETLLLNIEETRRMGARAQLFIRQRFTRDHMVAQIIEAILSSRNLYASDIPPNQANEFTK